jgi:hypothetical protein
MAMATTWVMAMMTRVEGNKEGNSKKKGKGGKGKGDGDGDKDGMQAIATTRAMAMTTR